jgi:hypothetical protein
MIERVSTMTEDELRRAYLDCQTINRANCQSWGRGPLPGRRDAHGQRRTGRNNALASTFSSGSAHPCNPWYWRPLFAFCGGRGIKVTELKGDLNARSPESQKRPNHHNVPSDLNELQTTRFR